MDTILEQLYSAFQRVNISAKEAAAFQKNRPLVETVLQKITENELDGLYSAFSDEFMADCEACFIQGYRLGVQLTLAGLEPIME